MTASETEVLYKLVQQVDDMSKQLAQNTKDTQSIKSTLDNLTGGRQALMWITGISLSLAALIIAGLNVFKK